MYGFSRTKRVTDPLDEKARARIIGRDRAEPDYVSSGSEHSAHAEDDVADLFFCFSDGDGEDSSPESDDHGNSDERAPPSVSEHSEDHAQIVVVMDDDRRDEFKNALEDHVSKALQLLAGTRSEKQVLRRGVMAYLRNCGYNAAVCKTRWASSGGLTAGNHEFVDVVAEEGGARYFVDLDFASEFEIARPTSSYELLRRGLPEVFVGGSEDLKRILKAVSAAERRSLRSGGLHVPPWRKHRFMQNMWMGPYRRTVNVFPASFCPENNSYGVVECRAVGFDSDVNGGRLVLPAAARTR